MLPFKGITKSKHCKNAGTSELTDGEREKYLVLSYENRNNAMRPQRKNRVHVVLEE
jgi:hypothetical protein